MANTTGGIGWRRCCGGGSSGPVRSAGRRRRPGIERQPVNLLDLLNTPDLCLEPNGVADLARRAEAGQSLPLGQYAKAARIGDDVLIARDPLGCAKVFYGRNGAGDLVV